MLAWDTVVGRFAAHQVIKAPDDAAARKHAIEHLVGRKIGSYLGVVARTDCWSEIQSIVESEENQTWALMPLEVFLVMRV